MESWTWMVAAAIRMLVLVGVAWLALWIYRDIAARSAAVGKLVALGLAVRAALGLGLFFVSYLDLPIASSLHTGDGFWELAPDARLYYDSAVAGVNQGLGSIDPSAPSPAFIRALAVWMLAVGVSPAAGSLLNLCCYLLVCLVLVRLLLPNVRAAVVAVAAFTLSPSLIVFGTQPLKDVFFTTLVVCLSVAAWRLFQERADGSRRHWWLATLVAALALYLIAGIRTYYAVFLWGSMALVLGGTAAMSWKRGLRPNVGHAATALLVCWMGIVAGSGVYLDVLSRKIFGGPPGVAASGAPVLSRAVHAFDEARVGFVQSGGGTNVGGEISAEGLTGRIKAIGFGALVLTVPISALEALDVVDVPGGRGLMVVADTDTLFVDASIIAVAILLFRARRDHLNTRYAAFLFVVALATGFSLAYVVTNFGTLFRLRLMAVVPLWMLPLALAAEGGRLSPARHRVSEPVLASTGEAVPGGSAADA